MRHQTSRCTKASRRQFLRVGGLAGIGLPQLLQMQSTLAAEGAQQDVNCIFIFILGGMPHQDMWDLKPDAPAEVRGDFNPINTVVPGIQVSDVLPGISKVTDKLAILRSMTHGDADHGRKGPMRAG